MIFNGKIYNAPSKMNLGGAASYHVGKLMAINGFSSILTLNVALFVDILELKSPITIEGPGALRITQDSKAAPNATRFATSVWNEGTINSNLELRGEDAHRATLKIETVGGVTVNLGGNFTIADKYSTTEWTGGGNITVTSGKTINNLGRFVSDSAGGQMKSSGAAKFNFNNRYRVENIAGNWNNCNFQNVAGGKVVKLPGQAGPTTFYFVGTYFQDDAGSQTLIESGKLEVVGTFTQADGDVSLDPGTELSISDAYAFEAGTINDVGYDSKLTVGSLTQSSGTLYITTGASLVSNAGVVVSGGVVNMLTSAYLGAASNVEIQSSAVLNAAGTIEVGGALLNAGTLNVGDGAGSPSVGFLTVLGNYTQTGALNMNLIGTSGTGTNVDYLSISGTANLGGSLNVSYLDGFMAYPPNSFNLISWGGYYGTFGSVGLPWLNYGKWNYSYSNGFTMWVSYY